MHLALGSTSQTKYRVSDLSDPFYDWTGRELAPSIASAIGLSLFRVSGP